MKKHLSATDRCFCFYPPKKTSDYLMKTKIRRGLLALLVCIQALAALNAHAQRGGDRLFSLPRFERAVACIKHNEGLHGPKNHPYVGYGHRLLPGERPTGMRKQRIATFSFLFLAVKVEGERLTLAVVVFEHDFERLSSGGE